MGNQKKRKFLKENRCCRYYSDTAGFSTSRLDRVSNWLEQQVASRRLAGCSVLIGRKGGVVHYNHNGMADIDQNKPFTRDTIVRIYSMTKPVTAVAAMILYERGAFQLDDRVTAFLPDFLRLRFGQEATLRTLKLKNAYPDKRPLDSHLRFNLRLDVKQRDR